MGKYLLVLGAILSLSGCFRTRADIEKEKEETEVRSTLKQSVLSNQDQIDRLQSDIGKLLGRIEELEHSQRKEMGSLSAGQKGAEKNLNELYDRTDALKKIVTAHSVQNENLIKGQETLSKGQAALFEELKKIKEEQIASAADRERAAESKQKAPDVDTAFAAFEAKDYKSAITGFRNYLHSHPQGKLSTDARFHLGESLFLTKDFDDAIVEYSVIHEKSPKTPLGRKSTLRIAESFKALGKNKDAKAFARLVIESSPGTEEAKKAKRILK